MTEKPCARWIWCYLLLNLFLRFPPPPHPSFLSSDTTRVHRGGVGGGGGGVRLTHTISSSTYSMTSWAASNEARKESMQRHRAFYNHLITLLHRAAGITAKRKACVWVGGGGDPYFFSWKLRPNAHFRCRTEKYETAVN